VSAIAAVGWTGDLWTPARATALTRTMATATNPAGTTLEATVVRVGSGPYRLLGDGPGWPIVVRADLAAPKSGREDRRVPMVALVHLTDVHLIDAQSPTRVEFLDRYGSPFESAFRAQETLTTQVATSMMTRINSVGAGPITGRPFDLCVSTGDNIDNQQHNELAWFITTLDGGGLVPDSGAVGRYEGVQDGVSVDHHYWHPDSGISDDYKTINGFPDYPGLLGAAITAFNAPGLKMPWYSCYGNHDGLVQGNMPGVQPNNVRPLDEIATGMVKPTDLGAGVAPTDIQNAFANPSHVATLLMQGGAPVRTVTADAERRAVSIDEWITAHLSSPSAPDGHGYVEDMLGTTRLYYTFSVAPGVLGISLDTVNHGGYADGSVGEAQMAWLEARLIEASGRYRDAGGTEVRTGHTDQLVMLFSHHNVGTLANPSPDPANPAERRLTFTELHALLQRFPNVIAWVNGHTHVNRVNPVPDSTGYTGGFWEITTAAHVDYPEHARLVELVDNRDGTLSLFATIIEHAAPAGAKADDLSVLGLAAISRELSANDPQVNAADKLGAPTDLNVELLVAAPFDPNPAPSAPSTTTSTAGRSPIVATGADLRVPLVIGGSAIAGALAVRRRLERVTD
jgi:metallophosphoesterase (TIGR03767 family)